MPSFNDQFPPYRTGDGWHVVKITRKRADNELIPAYRVERTRDFALMGIIDDYRVSWVATTYSPVVTPRGKLTTSHSAWEAALTTVVTRWGFAPTMPLAHV